MRVGRLSVVSCALFFVASCKKPVPTPMPMDSDAAVEALTPPVAAPDAAPPVAGARCSAAESGVVLADGDLEIGEAIATKDGFAVGVLRKTDAGMMGSVALVAADVKSVSFVDLGAPYGDAPPPRPIARDGDVFAAFYVRAQPPRPGAPTPSSRDLSIFRVEAKKAQAVLVVPQGKDESLAFDLLLGKSGGIIAWDEDAVGMKNGDIKVAAIGPDLKLGVTRVASSEGTDAELPRVVARRGGYWGVWVASKPESGAEPTPDAAHELEGPGETRMYSWLEAVALDERGVPLGKVKRLTSATGHVSAFDVAARAASADAIDVIARDDDQAIDGSGGRIVRIAVTSDKADPPLAIVSEAAGRGAPILFGSATSWLSFSDTADRLRLVPLDESRAPTGAPSIEDALEKGRPLVLRADPLGLLAAFPSDAKAQLRLLRCSRNEAK